jgi:hypothetical protein
MVGGRRPAHQPRNNNRYSTKRLWDFPRHGRCWMNIRGFNLGWFDLRARQHSKEDLMIQIINIPIFSSLVGHNFDESWHDTTFHVCKLSSILKLETTRNGWGCFLRCITGINCLIAFVLPVSRLTPQWNLIVFQGPILLLLWRSVTCFWSRRS